MQTLDEKNALLRSAIECRRAAVAAGKPAEEWYATIAETVPTDPPFPQNVEEADDTEPPLRIHPASARFYELCDAVKAMHRSKSSDYGCPSGTDPLANIRNGAKFVGIEPWRAAMVRLSDKVARLATYNATGKLTYEGVEDTLLDLASYALLTLVLYEEEHRAD